MFKLKSDFKPTGDQPQAIEKLQNGIKLGLKNQVLLGVTGSGKTYTMANIIRNLNMPALIISHNKTLAGQLYQEMRDFFPENAISYFVSYYDFYQPEAYMPQTDTYIEKEAEVNELIDKLRLQSTANIMTRKDVVVVASVSCIYNIGSPKEYQNATYTINTGDAFDINNLSRKLINLLYERSEFDFKRGSFRVRGNRLDIYPAYEDFGYRLVEKSGLIGEILRIDPLTGKQTQMSNLPAGKAGVKCQNITIYPAKHFLADQSTFLEAEKQIRNDLKTEYTALKNQKKLTEAERLLRRVNYDLEMIKEVGYVNGIENYSRYLDGRKPGDPPYSLLTFFKEAYGDDFLVFIDESHMTVPQLRGMYNGDHARKTTLIDFGFRLKAAYDNRPLKFDEFYQIPKKIIYVSATPDEWEINKVKSEQLKIGSLKHQGIVEQLVRPTGIVDPKIIIKPAKDEIIDLIKEIEKRIVNKKFPEKILVTALTKKIAEDLANYLKEKKIRAEYLHSDILTLERSDILDNLRKNEYDVLIGVNLLREGLDLPEVTLVAILDADKEGFLRSRTSLIQTMGRAARNVNSEVIIYADEITRSIRLAIDEIDRRRKYQTDYNQKHGITPETIYKPIRERIIEKDKELTLFDKPKAEVDDSYLGSLKIESLTPYDKKRILKKLKREMKQQATDLNFEMAIKIRDKVRELESL